MLRIRTITLITGIIGMLMGASLVPAQPTPAAPPTRDVTVEQPAPGPAADLPATDRRVLQTMLAAGVATDVQGRLTEHLWVVRIFDNGEFLLAHRMMRDEPDALYRALLSRGRPVAVAGHANRLFVVYDDLSVQAIRHRVTQDPQLSPFPTTQLPPLPRPGQVLAFAAGRQGPWALVRLDADAAAGETETAQAAGATIQLVREAAGKWETVPLPEGVDAAAVRSLLMLGDDADEPALVTMLPESRIRVDHRQGDAWITHTYDTPWKAGTQAVAVQDLYLVQPTDGREGGPLSVLLLRRGSSYPTGRFAAMQDVEKWWAAGGANRVVLLVVDDENRLGWTVLDVQGAFADAPPITPLEIADPPTLMADPMLLVVAALIIGMMLLFATARRDPKSALPHLPPDARPATVNRFLAAVIDLLPAIGVALLIFGIQNPSELFRHWPGFTPDWTESIPAITAIGIFVGHTFLTELLAGATLGKWITGCRVVHLDGGRPRAWQIIARNIFKAVELAAPLLLVMPLLGMHHQRLGDLIGRTVVINRRREDQPQP